MGSLPLRIPLFTQKMMRETFLIFISPKCKLGNTFNSWTEGTIRYSAESWKDWSQRKLRAKSDQTYSKLTLKLLQTYTKLIENLLEYWSKVTQNLFETYTKLDPNLLQTFYKLPSNLLQTYSKPPPNLPLWITVITTQLIPAELEHAIMSGQDFPQGLAGWVAGLGKSWD